jgi:hypothetical protein
MSFGQVVTSFLAIPSTLNNSECLYFRYLHNRNGGDLRFKKKKDIQVLGSTILERETGREKLSD